MTEAFRFVTGGTLPPGNGSYVRRPADDALLQACLERSFAYVLSSRQMGKSSLLARAIAALRERGVTVAMVDLTAIGTQGVTPETWYAGVLAEVESACRPATDLFEWWAQAASQPPVQRFVRYLSEVLMAQVSTPVVIVIDEIDSTLKLDFSDDFFAAIRHLHNARAEHPALARLSFVLAGVATPTELMHDPLRTPFNIGRRIAVDDFTADEARTLVARVGLGPADTEAALADVLRWTGGQPYLTQRLCALLAEQVAARSALPVADLVARTMLSDTGRSDPHFQTVAKFMTEAAAEVKAPMFDTYAQVLGGRRVVCQDASPVHNRLRLCGIVKRSGELLVVRNGIYRDLFGPEWLKRYRPTFWTQTNQLWAAALVVSVLVSGAFFWLWQQAETAKEAASQAAQQARQAARQASQAAEAQRLATGDAQAAKLVVSATLARYTSDPDAALDDARKALANRATPEALITAVQTADRHQTEAVMRGHRDALTRVAVHAGSRTAASASYDGRVRLWRLPTGEPLHELIGHNGAVTAVAFSPKGEQVASAGHDHTARLWDSRSGALLHTLRGHSDRLLAVTYSPDGSWVATASEDGTARLWRSGDGSPLQTLPQPGSPTDKQAGQPGWVRCLAFSPDGRYLATAGNDGDVRLWTVADGRLAARLTGHRDWVRSLAFSSDSRHLLSASDDQTVRLWSVKTRRSEQVLGGLGVSVRSAAFDATGQRVVAAGGDGRVMVWRRQDGERLGQWQAFRGWAQAAGFVEGAADPANQVWSVGDDGSGAVFELGRDAPLLTLLGHTASIADAVADPATKTLLTAGEDHQARLWSLQPGALLAQWRLGNKPVNDLAWSADGRQLLFGGEDGIVSLAGTAPASPGRMTTRTLRHGADQITAVALSPDGSLAATAAKLDPARRGVPQPTVRLFDTRATRERALVGTGHLDTVNAVSFSPAGRWLASGGDDAQAVLWDVTGRQPALALRGHQDAINSIVFSADGRRLLSASSDGSARLWSVPDGRLLQVLMHSRDGQPVNMARFSADGQMIATAGDDTLVRLWHTDSGTPLRTLTGHAQAVMSAVFSPDGTRIVSASRDQEARVWPVDGDKPLMTLQAGTTGKARSALFSPDGRLIATASDEGHVRLWRAKDGVKVGEYLHTDLIWTLAFDATGRRLASASEDGTASVWDLDRSGADATRLLDWMTRRLTRLKPAAAAASSATAPAPPAVR